LQEQFKYALPILDELNIPAVFFANSINYEEQKVSTVHKIHLLRSIISPKEFLVILLSQNSAITISDTDYIKAQSIYIYDEKESAGLKYLLNFKLDFKAQEQLINTIFGHYFETIEILNKLYMSQEQLINLSKKGFLGSHTHSHFSIGLLDDNVIKFELEHSKQYFEKLTDTKIEMVAYPYGSPEACTDKVASIARAIGYKLGFTTTRGVNTIENNLLLLNRFDCNDLPGGKSYKAL
jgi:peptidoglycan/xylan/chitin deacetylase (PgdA/CDA1 family)